MRQTGQFICLLFQKEREDLEGEVSRNISHRKLIINLLFQKERM